MTSTSSRSKSKSAKNRRSGTKRAKAGRRRSSGGGMFLWGFLGLLVVLFAVIAVVSRTGGPEMTAAEASGEALPTFAEGDDPAVGQPAPTLTGQTFDGESITIDPGDGTPKAIMFLAHWCEFCQREVPVVQQWLEQGGLPDDVEIYAVATGIDRNRPNFPPQDWLERENLEVPTLVDGNDAARNAYGLATYPYWVLVDGDGEVVERWSGASSAQEIDARIGTLADGQASG